MGSRIDIAEYRGDFLPLKGVRGGDESERGNDDFSGEAQSANGDFKGYSGVAHGDAVANGDEFGDALLEFLDVGAVVGEPVAVEHVVDAREETARLPMLGRPTWSFSAKAGEAPKMARS